MSFGRLCVCIGVWQKVCVCIISGFEGPRVLNPGDTKTGALKVKFLQGPFINDVTKIIGHKTVC